MKNFIIRSCQVILIASSLVAINSCKKDNNSPENPFNGKTKANFNSSMTYGTVTDQDGNSYKTITIGTQTWMAENLRTTHYQNGDAILTFIDIMVGINESKGAYCNYNNWSSTDSIATYGRLYNWFAVIDNRDIAPKGWHIPTEAEWMILTAYLGGNLVAGGKLKESGTTHWETPNAGATNQSGFTALPGGYCYSDGTSSHIGLHGAFFSSTEGVFNGALVIVVNNEINNCYIANWDLTAGCSVRCIKDL